ncbi:MAG TPA: hypothetical protein VGA18_02125, partial [Rhodothermales bacterium]
MKIRLLLLICSIHITLAPASFGFKTPTHEEINDRAAASSGRMTAYLTGSLRLSQGIDTEINGRPIRTWLRLGGVQEDDFPRFLNHFHSPLRSWSAAGLSGAQSSVRWAQEPDQSPGTVGPQSPSSQASWWDSRIAFYKGLILETDSERQAALGDAFLILGHMTHLIGDLAQPAHTRDDSHAHTNIAGVEIGDDSDDFETFMVRPDNQHRIAGFKAFDPGNPSVFKVATGDGIAKAPVAWIWDTNRYVKTTPDEANPAVTVGSNIGLAEFSSANFFSHDTIYQTTSDNVDLPYPAINRLGVGPLEPYPPTGEERQYLSRCEGPPSCQYGVFVEHMVAEGIFFRFTPPFIVTAANYVLDDLVFTDYAAELMPRAIGYSSSLLDYFFRAEIDLVVDPANPGQYLIKNLSSDPMDGVFELHYDDVNGERQFPVETERVTVPAGGTLPFIFDAPADAATPGEYILVFKGGIGLEGDGGSDSEFAVAAKVVTLPVTGLIRTSGGDALGFAAPGDGGVVVLEAGADIPQMASATGPLFVPPGQTVTLSGADLTYTEIDVRGTLEIIGVATLASHGATSITGTVTAMRDERNGADLTIESVGPTAITGRIVTAGMNGEDLGGTTETGGRGGNVTIRTESTGTFTVPTIVTRGGDANRTDLRSPQTTFDGGWGGDVTVMTHGVPIRFAGDKISSGSVDR